MSVKVSSQSYARKEAINKVDVTGAATVPLYDASVLPQSGFLTADWVKRHYSISNSTLYKWIAEGRFPAPVKIGPRAVRWASTALQKFEASLTGDGH